MPEQLVFISIFDIFIKKDVLSLDIMYQYPSNYLILANRIFAEDKVGWLQFLFSSFLFNLIFLITLYLFILLDPLISYH